MKLRAYQQRLVDLTISHLAEFPEANPIVWAATGAGKSLVASALADAILEDHRGDRGAVLVLAHRKELISQNHAKLPKHLHGSIFSASVGKKDLTGQVIFAGIQSIRNHWHKLPKLHAILIDECQWAVKGYREFIDKVLTLSPQCRVIGLTATPYNGAGVWLHMLPAEERIFTGISAEVGIGELLKLNFLTPVTPFTSSTRLDVSAVPINARTGDFDAGQLQRAVDVPELVQNCAAEIQAIFFERNSVLVFCAGVEHAEHVCQALLDLGETAAVVTGASTKEERERHIADFKSGKVKYLISVDVLSVGFDAPNADGLACLRPTKSPLVWVQMVGRVMRLFDGKLDGLVADFTSNSADFPPLDEIEGHPPKAKGGGDAPVKICDNCFNIILAGLRKCPNCGHEFIFAEHDAHRFDAETGLLISGVVKNEDGSKTYPVERVDYRSQMTRSGAPALVVDYYSANRKSPVSSEFLNLWHHSPAEANRAASKWLRRLKNPGGVPLNIGEALARASLGALKQPKTVTVKPGSPFPIRFTA